MRWFAFALLGLACHSALAQPADARVGVMHLVDDELAAIRAGDAAAWDNLWVGHAAALPANATHATRADELRIALTPSRTSAWLSADLDGLRVTEIAVRTSDGWRVLIASMSTAMPAEDALAAAAAAASAGVDAQQPALIAQFDAGLADLHALAASVAERDDVVVIGSGPGEIAVGATAVRAALLAQADHVAFIRRGGARAGLSPDGKLGWVAASADLSLSEADGAHATAPMRVVAFYLRSDDGWRLVAAHFSVRRN